MNNFIWGIIGPGNIAQEFAEDLKLVKDSYQKLGAVLSHKIEKAEKFADEKNAPQYFDSINSFTSEANVNAVYIATPHPHHYKEALYCLDRKIPVLCEKPMGINSRQVREMIQKSRVEQTFLMEGMWTRFLPSLDKVIEQVNNDAIGEVTHIRAQLSFKAPRDTRNRYFNPQLGGGSLLDLGIYPIFLAHFFLGMPKNISAQAKLSVKRIDELCTVILDHGNGKFSMLESSLLIDLPNTAVISGTKGAITIGNPWNEQPEYIRLDNDEGTQYFHTSWQGKGLHYEVAEVVNCVKNGMIQSEAYPHWASIQIAEIMDEIRRQTGIIYPFD